MSSTTAKADSNSRRAATGGNEGSGSPLDCRRAHQHQQHSPAPESFSIMVTDINHHVRDLLRRELERDGYAVSCVRSGIEAYRCICRPESVDLIILDPELLYPYGQALLGDALKQEAALPIILHTYDEFIAGLQMGSNVHFVEKSATSISQLKKTIRALCSAKAGR